MLGLHMMFNPPFWTPSGSWKGPMKWGLTVLLSFRLSGCFLGIASLVFSKFWHGARNPYEVVCDIAGFSRKKKISPKIERMDQKWAKNMVFEFIEKFWHSFLLNLVYNENLYYLLSSCTNCMFGKIFVHEIWAKLFSANQIAGFCNQPYHQNKSMKCW